MRLYLSSAGLGSHLEQLQAMLGGGRKVLYVGNANDGNDSYRDDHVSDKKAEFESFGFEFFELDLRQYFAPEKHEVLRTIVEATDLLWVGGGNTFVLRRAMAYSGLDVIVANSLKQNIFVYGGSSAGSIVITKTLHGAENGDDPYVVPAGYKAHIIWDGLGLIYPQLVPHFQSEWFGEEAKAMIDYFETNGFKYETLKDGEVYVVDGEYEEKRI